ncbi:ATP-binding cassette domain-containing protein [Roseomonas sp. USHLN139]|uniref:ATP-binding cassette domain-containing protein n=1 Tax=Roseomonas sp. USHLN139 TaxID=3081298 RepID=UPI003B01304F
MPEFRKNPRITDLQGQFGLGIASMCLNILSLSVPIVVLHVYDRVLPNGTGQTLASMLLGLAILVVAEIALRIARASIALRVDSLREHLVRCRLMRDVMRGTPQALSGFSTAEISTGIAAAAVLRESRTQRLQVLFDLPFGLLFLVLIGIIGGGLVLVPLGVAGLFLLMGWQVSRQLAYADLQRLRAEQQRDSFLRGVFPALALARGLCADLLLPGKLQRLQEGHATLLRDTITLGTILREVFAVAGQVQVALVVGIGALLVLEGRLSTGGLAACTLLAGRVMQPLQSGLGLLQGWHEARRAREAMGRLQALAVENIELEASEALWTAPPAIRMQGIRFAADDGGPPLALEVPAGKLVTIEAPPGSPCRSLLAALLGYVEVAEGEIMLGETRLSPATAPLVRRQAALIGRSTTLFSGSLMDNLTGFGHPEREAEVQYLSFLFGLDTAVKRLPDGYDTPIEQGGRSLPVGIRQGAALVSALSAKPRLLLLDEAEIGLDPAAQLRLGDFLKRLKGRATLIVLTGNAALRKHADLKLRFQDSRLVAEA